MVYWHNTGNTDLAPLASKILHEDRWLWWLLDLHTNGPDKFHGPSKQVILYNMTMTKIEKATVKFQNIRCVSIS